MFGLRFGLSLTLAASLAPLTIRTAWAADTKVACVGNSITYGMGLDRQDLQNYPRQLDSILGTGWAATNLGNSGKTMLRNVNDAYWKQPEFSKTFALNPDLIVIELGTNDAKDYIWPYNKSSFAKDYRAMIDTFRTLSSRPKIWATLQPRANNLSWGMPDTTIARQVNPLILSTALAAGAGVIDLRTGMAGHPEWMQSDSVHPNAAGALGMAKIVAAVLKHAPATVAESGGGLVASEGAGWQWYRDGVLLAGDTARTLAARGAGTYKVSVRIQAGSQSRIVSEPFVWGGSSALADVERATAVRVALDGRGRLQVKVPGGGRIERAELRDRNGRKLTLPVRESGVCFWEVVVDGRRWTGSLVAAPGR